jgi:leucyl aminopeptidase
MTAAIELSIETTPFERIEADLAVAGFFLDERPLRGAAGRADWRLCGAVSDLVGSGRLRGKVGEATLVPSMGRLAADRVLLLGLGRRSSFRAGRARDTSHAAVHRGLELGAESVVFAPPIGGPEAFSRHASGFVRGAIEAARSFGDRTLRVAIAMHPAQAKDSVKSLEKAVAADTAGAISWLGLRHGRADFPAGA